MTRIEGIYQKYLKTIPRNQIITLSSKDSQEIEIKISEAFCKKHAQHYSKPNKNILALVKNLYQFIFKRSDKGKGD
jgi:hypothetical protein